MCEALSHVTRGVLQGIRATVSEYGPKGHCPMVSEWRYGCAAHTCFFTTADGKDRLDRGTVIRKALAIGGVIEFASAIAPMEDFRAPHNPLWLTQWKTPTQHVNHLKLGTLFDMVAEHSQAGGLDGWRHASGVRAALSSRCRAWSHQGR
jgi:hypothetical protein